MVHKTQHQGCPDNAQTAASSVPSSGGTPVCWVPGSGNVTLQELGEEEPDLPDGPRPSDLDHAGSGERIRNVLGFVKLTVGTLDNGRTITVHTDRAGPTSQPGVIGAEDFGQRAVRLVGQGQGHF
jgi:hypothetical protein